MAHIIVAATVQVVYHGRRSTRPLPTFDYMQKQILISNHGEEKKKRATQYTYKRVQGREQIRDAT
jgi:hypothetical protein